MNFLQTSLYRIDLFQRRHGAISFPYAVIKKYSDDQAGSQAALITYYGFLSLFPLLLVLTTIAGIIGRHDPAFGHRLVTSVSSYFPVVGQQLDKSVHGLNRGGASLVVGVLFTIYGARGVANAFRTAINIVWHIPKSKRSGFPKSLLRSLGLIIGGGGGFLAAAVIAGLAASAGHGVAFRCLSIVINLIILALVFVLLLKMSLPLHIGWHEVRLGASLAAIGITILQIVGGYIVTHESKHFSSSYSTLFATTLGLLAWIYLQAQIMLYAIEIGTVRDRKLWPRGLSGQNPTEADQQIADSQSSGG